MVTDAISSLLNKKLLTEHDVVGGDGEEIISKLSDNILLYILSFLPIKDFLRTSALSTRWKYLWTSISEIDVDETSHDLGLGMRTSFLDSEERLLCFRDASCIRKFRLMLLMTVSSSRVNSWVSSAISHKVQELELSLPDETLLCCLIVSLLLNLSLC